MDQPQEMDQITLHIGKDWTPGERTEHPKEMDQPKMMDQPKIMDQITRQADKGQAWRVVLDAGFLMVCPVQPESITWVTI
nr:hypothetical protein BaRGS_007411 [Batillaria attramentaria]